MNLQDLCERIVRDAIPATDSGATCFVPRYQIDQLREALSAHKPPASELSSGDKRPISPVKPLAEAQADEVVCLECGQPTMHMGQVCYACSHPAAKPAEAQAQGDYSGCCDTPAYCSSVRRCTAKDAAPPSAPVGVEGLPQPFGYVEPRHDLSGYEVFDEPGPRRAAIWSMHGMRKALAQTRAHYSIDADPDGIRERVADAITGAISFGAQGAHKPPAGHWLEPFWDMARAEREATVPPTVDEATARRLDDYLGGEFDIRIGKQAAHAALVHALAQQPAAVGAEGQYEEVTPEVAYIHFDNEDAPDWNGQKVRVSLAAQPGGES